MNEHTGKELDKLQDELSILQEEMMNKARAIEARLEIVKTLRECEVNGHFWKLLYAPSPHENEFFALSSKVELQCQNCHAYADTVEKNIWLVYQGEKISIREFLGNAESEEE